MAASLDRGAGMQPSSTPMVWPVAGSTNCCESGGLVGALQISDQECESQTALRLCLTTSPESWPGSSRPSTSCLLSCGKKDVDARDKRGHDAGEAIRCHRNAPQWPQAVATCRSE